MSDPSKDLNLGELWEQSRVKVSMLPPRFGNKKKPPKKKESSASGGRNDQPKKAPGAPKSGGSSQPVTPSSQLTVAVADPPQTSNAAPEAEARLNRPREDAAASEADLKKRKAEIQERLAEKGKLPSISDLEACKRVGEHGLELFNELAELMAGELTKRLEGKISALVVENRYLEGKLFRVKKDLYDFRDKNLVSFSEDNRALKEELERLRPLEEALEKANLEAAELKKKVKRLPEAEKEIEAAKTRAQEAAEREEELKKQVQSLKEAEAKYKDQLTRASLAGFQRCVEIAAVLDPYMKFSYFDGSFEARDGKLYKGGQVAYDPAVDGESEAEEGGEEQGKTPATAEADAGGKEAATEPDAAA